MKELHDLLKTIPQNMWNRTVRKNKSWIDFLKKYPSDSINEQLFLFYHELSCAPICAVDGCNNHVNWIRNSHYTNTCGYVCSQVYKKQSGKIDDIIEKTKLTMIKKFGTDNPSKNKDSLDKRNKTMKERYGGISPIQKAARVKNAKILNAKKNKTMMEKYGVENPSQMQDHRDKIKKTLLERYGVESIIAIPHVRERLESKKMEKWTDSYKNVTIQEWIEPTPELNSKFANPNMRIRFTCNTCNTENTLPTETFKFRIREYSTPCSICADIPENKSKQQNDIERFISIDLGIHLLSNDRTVISPYELDIYLPEMNIAIEYCGLYWHSEKQGKDQKYHIHKHNLCDQKNIRLITIFEDEWVQKPDVVKARLTNILKKNATKLMARKLTVKKITPKIANKFCNENHIQGAGKTNFAYGLFDTDSLYAVMTFAKPNIAKGSKNTTFFELNRFCVKLNHTIIGGASKLFSAFIKEIDPDKIISYSDIRWNTGNLYKQLGFSQQSSTKPGYWYIKLNEVKRLHRFSLRKNKDDDPSLTEWENRQKQGWNRIWDCGNTKWEWNKKSGE